MPPRRDRNRKKTMDNAEEPPPSKEKLHELASKCDNYLTILDRFPEYMYVCDLDTHEVLFMNERFRSLLKDPKPGMKCHQLFHGQEEPCDFCTDSIIKKTGMPHVWESHNEYLGRHFLNTDQMITWHDGRKVRFETAIDITDQKMIEALLQASETKYRSFIEQSAYGFFILNMNQEVTYLNKVARGICGIGEKDPLKLRMSELLEPVDYEIAMSNMKAVSAGKEVPGPTIYRVKLPDGVPKTVEVQSFPIWRDGVLKGFHGTVVDITDRITAENNLREKSEFLDAVINNASDGIFVLDEDIRYALINPASGRILGHDPEEWIGKAAGTNKHPDDEKIALESFMKVVNGEPSNCELRVRAKDGAYHLLDIRYNPMMLNGKLHVLGMVSDITEKRRAENALRESEEKFRNLFEHSPESITLLNPEGEVLEYNKATIKLFNPEIENIQGKRLEDVCRIEAPELNYFKGAMDSVAAGSRMERIELEFKDSCGNLVWAEIFPLLVRKGESHAIQLISRDITERKHKELELRKRFIRFELEDGYTYLAKERRPLHALEAFRELLAVGYSGTVITREHKKICDRNIDRVYRYARVSDTKTGHPDTLNPGQILDFISSLPRGEALLMDCLEYCISRMGSAKNLEMIQDIKDRAIERRLIILFSVNSSALSERDMKMIETETNDISSSQSAHRLPEKLLETLAYIDRENRAGIKPSYSDIGKELGLSKPTVRTRVIKLVRDGAIKETHRGREKVLEVTETGRNHLY